MIDLPSMNLLPKLDLSKAKHDQIELGSFESTSKISKTYTDADLGNEVFELFVSDFFPESAGLECEDYNNNIDTSRSRTSTHDYDSYESFKGFQNQESSMYVLI